MKQYLLSVCILFVCISGTLLLPQRSYGQLSGSYTINPTKAASSTNYKNWASAVSDLVSGSRTDGGTAKGPGVSGAVTFSVYDTLYSNTNVAITAITGASATNTITFQSAKGDSSKCRLQYASSTSSTDDYVLLLDGADYITFRQIGFERTGSNTYNTVVQITNDADNNKFIRCSMIGIKQASNTTQGFGNGQGSCIYVIGNADSTQIIQNRLLYGYNGVFFNVASAGNKVFNNRIDTAGGSGVFGTYQSQLKIIGNIINMGDFGTGSGQYVSYAIRLEYSSGFDIAKNKCLMLATNCGTVRAMVFFYCASTAAVPGLVYNNWALISGGTGYSTGLSSYGVDYIHYIYNNILVTSSTTDACAYFHNPGYTNTNVKLINNNLINKAGGYAVFTGAATTGFDTVNYNNLFSSGTNIGNWGGSGITTLAAWQKASGLDANSINIDPTYVSNYNLHVINQGLKGKGMPRYNIKDDIDGDLRDVNTPFIGADELPPAPNDAGIIAVTKPVANTCAGTLSVEVVVKNYGTSPLKTAKINWSLAGVAQPQYSWSGNLATNATDTVVIGTYNFLSNINPKFIVKTSLPNGVTDGFIFNDSVLLVRGLKAAPSINLGADIAYCAGDSALIGPVNNPTMSYKWMTLAGSVFATTSQIYVKPTTKTSYVLEIKSNSFGCTNRDTIAVDINAKPVADAGANASICPGGSVQLGKAPQSGFTYSWSSNPSGFSSTASDPTVTPSVTTIYTIVKTIVATGCKASASATVTVNALPTPKVFGTSTVCYGDKFTYMTNPATGSTYKWSLSGGQLLSGQSTNSINIRWNLADTNTVKVVETNAALCKDSSVLDVIVIAKPVAAFTSTAVCKGNVTNFTNTSTDAVSNDWKFGDGGNSSQTNPTHTYATAGNYTTQLIVKNSNGCADTGSKQVTVHPIPVANFGMTKIAEKTFSFSDSSTVASGAIASWHWEFGDGDTSLLNAPQHQYTAAGNVIVKLCVTSAAGCENCFSRNYNVLGWSGPELNKHVLIQPNPGEGLFSIASTNPIEQALVYNANGQLLLTLNPAAARFNIDLSEFNSGVYFVKISAVQFHGTLKLIKQ